MEKLNLLADKEDVVLNEAQAKTIDETILKTKEELQKSGIDAFKNLYFAKGLKANNEEKWEESIRLWTNYIDLDDSNDKAFFLRAWAYIKLGFDTDKAMLDYNESIKLNPNNFRAFNNRARIYQRLTEYDKAIEDYSKAIEISPDYALAFNNRAKTYRLMGKFVEAKIDFEKANELNPEKFKIDL